MTEANKNVEMLYTGSLYTQDVDSRYCFIYMIGASQTHVENPEIVTFQFLF